MSKVSCIMKIMLLGTRPPCHNTYVYIRMISLLYHTAPDLKTKALVRRLTLQSAVLSSGYCLLCMCSLCPCGVHPLFPGFLSLLPSSWIGGTESHLFVNVSGLDWCIPASRSSAILTRMKMLQMSSE